MPDVTRGRVVIMTIAGMALLGALTQGRVEAASKDDVQGDLVPSINTHYINTRYIRTNVGGKDCLFEISYKESDRNDGTYNCRGSVLVRATGPAGWTGPTGFTGPTSWTVQADEVRFAIPMDMLHFPRMEMKGHVRIARQVGENEERITTEHAIVDETGSLKLFGTSHEEIGAGSATEKK
jgi:hypothetical protein